MAVLKTDPRGGWLNGTTTGQAVWDRNKRLRRWVTGRAYRLRDASGTCDSPEWLRDNWPD